MTQNTDCLIVGGGAAGFFSAVVCGEANPDVKIAVLEAGREFLSKVKISGGGRCNVTHHCFEPARLILNYPRGTKALRGAFSRFQPRDAMAWFEKQGAELKTERDGRVFPVSDDSQTIVDCLLTAAKERGVLLRTQAPVLTAEVIDSGFRVTLKDGQLWETRRLLLATGSHPTGYRLAQALGHGLEPPVPSLFTLTVKDPRLTDLAGVAVDGAEITLLDDQGKPLKSLQQRGPLLITHWGLSGPAVLKLSAWGARYLQERRYQCQCRVNWLPPQNPETLLAELLSLKSGQPRKQIGAYCPLDLPKRLWQSLTQFVGIPPELTWADVSKVQLRRLALELTQGVYQIRGKGAFKEEFVTCGGVPLGEVNFSAMESRRCPGLYFAGEILDIDGVTGGFNFQSAWTTGALAGRAMAEERRPR
ncbi:MAG: NAD(P)/FAD-dependent oxidoreductase [Cyanobacteriota bacterium]|nr:NAD(P)/FAD-dependent oxidoreductase [Cyanobacteriota bacterium]